MEIRKTEIDDLFVIEADPFVDHRGSFTRLFCAEELSTVIGKRKIVQINLSRTKEVGALRGLHFQYPPRAEMKMVRCIRGRIWDVAVDIRAGSKTYLKWHAEELTPKNAKMMIIPEGFAHGIQILEKNSELLYFATEYYAPAYEGGLRYDDRKLKIDWPLKATDISKRDQSHKLIGKDFKGIKIGG